MNKASYKGIVGGNLARKKALPGDTLTLTIRNEESDEGMYAQVKRLNTMFLLCYGFFPQSIAVSPNHLEILKQQGRRLDITVSEEAAKAIGGYMDLTGLPRVTPLVADATLDLFTVVARFEFRMDDMQELLTEALLAALGGTGEP